MCSADCGHPYRLLSRRSMALAESRFVAILAPAHAAVHSSAKQLHPFPASAAARSRHRPASLSACVYAAVSGP